MKNYVYEMVYVNGKNAPEMMSILGKEGWKELQFYPNNRDCDASPDEIGGYRPLTKKELNEIKKWVNNEKNKDIKELFHLAKKYGYKTVKSK